MPRSAVALALGAVLSVAWGGELPKPIFYLPLDGTSTAAIAGGGRHPRHTSESDAILTLVELGRPQFAPGRVGQCSEARQAPLVFPCRGNFRPDEGAVSLWLCPEFRGDDKGIYCTFFGAADWGMLYKYLEHTSLTLGTAKPKGDLYYDCGVPGISSWLPGQWHHVVACWSRRENARRIYVDGKLEARAPFPWHRPVTDGPLFIGGGCTLYPDHVAHAKLDEVAIWDRPLDGEAVRRLHQLGSQGKPLWQVQKPTDAMPSIVSRLNVVQPRTPAPPQTQPAEPRRSRTRLVVPLDGWWAFLPAERPVATLPAAGWGLSRVPGYWTSRGETLGLDGRRLPQLGVGYYQRSFVADAAWRGKAVFLHLAGVDGLAEVFVNGQCLSRLAHWEPEAVDVAPLLRYDEENVVTIVVHMRGGARIGGIYGSVSLRVLPLSFVHDVAVRPRVTKGQVEFSCDVFHSGEPTEGRIEFEIAPDSAPKTATKRFVHRCRLSKAKRTSPVLSAEVQRIECSFEWPDARLWTYDDPFLYRVTARLHVGGRLVDETPAVRFGFREFTMRGSDFFLNGKPTHLRGHQIDLGWGNQMERVKELKAAGMNCFEFSGPICHNWYAGKPYQAKRFEDILTYADEHGLLALPILPGARVLQERLFDAEVARLYRRRLDKHIRRYGNHPSVAMWFMHFNHAGYRWYHPPQKIDGSYKPADAGFRRKERYCLEAQRIAQGVDPRPIYHHACGNFGDIFTLNCYIGPTSPLQEREEWPSRWAAKRPFPLLACEHGLLLVPYWFRPRQFPLSVVYADEPIFDELAAKYLGRRAYAMLTPELFDVYEVGRKPSGSRLRRLVVGHPGYQAVKALFARHSLRAWRTWGVSGIVFNAINWDFEGADAQPLPVMQALARYFGDTDLHVAGPKDDWPSKDHSFCSGERIEKQVVLLNDLTRDLPCPIAWRLESASGKAHAAGKLEAVARAGRPTFVPLECVAPLVSARTRFRLVVGPLPGSSPHFEPDVFALEVFPPARRPEVRSTVLVHDPEGETAAMLRKAGVDAEPLRETSELRRACMLIVGRDAYGPGFLTLARAIGLGRAVAEGLNLLVLEQAAGEVMGLKLEEQSARRVFVCTPTHPVLEGLGAEDFVNLRGESDLIEPYPEAAPETQQRWPTRYFKWGNRGVVATVVYRKPHYAPFVPILECGFDLVDSPLMEARLGNGRIVLCQVDVTGRYGVDPVSTRLVHNLIAELGTRGSAPPRACSVVGASARRFVEQFGISPVEFGGGPDALVVVGPEPLDAKAAAAIEHAARQGATVLLLPGARLSAACGPRRVRRRFFIGRVAAHPLLAGLSDGDLYLKSWTTMETIQAGEGWQVVAEPGLVAVKPLGKGRVVACQLDVGQLGRTRGRIKALRFWNVLLANLRARRVWLDAGLSRRRKGYEPNPWEEIPPFINW